jgi:hypothetical protein
MLPHAVHAALRCEPTSLQTVTTSRPPFTSIDLPRPIKPASALAYHCGCRRAAVLAAGTERLLPVGAAAVTAFLTGTAVAIKEQACTLKLVHKTVFCSFILLLVLDFITATPLLQKIEQRNECCLN